MEEAWRYGRPAKINVYPPSTHTTNNGEYICRKKVERWATEPGIGIGQGNLIRPKMRAGGKI